MDASDDTIGNALRMSRAALAGLPGPPARRKAVVAFSAAEVAAIFYGVSRAVRIPYLRYVVAAMVSLESLGLATIPAFFATLLIWPEDEHGHRMQTEEFWTGSK